MQWRRNAKIYLVEAASNSYTDLLNAVSVANSLCEVGGRRRGFDELGRQRVLLRNLLRSLFYPIRGRLLRVLRRQSRRDLAIHFPQRRLGRRHQHQPEPDDRRLPAGDRLAIGRRRPQPLRISSQLIRTRFRRIVQSRRGTPDVAADADPSTGVWVYDSHIGISSAAPALRPRFGPASSTAASSFSARKPERTHHPLCQQREASLICRHHARLLRPKPRLPRRDGLGLLHRRRQSGRKGGK